MCTMKEIKQGFCLSFPTISGSNGREHLKLFWWEVGQYRTQKDMKNFDPKLLLSLALHLTKLWYASKKTKVRGWPTDKRLDPLSFRDILEGLYKLKFSSAELLLFLFFFHPYLWVNLAFDHSKVLNSFQSQYLQWNCTVQAVQAWLSPKVSLVTSNER